MSYTRPTEFPTLKQFLREDDEDLVAGLRQVLGDIKSAWGNVGKATDKMRDSALKKLPADVRVKVETLINSFFDQMLNDIAKPPNYRYLTQSLGTAEEAHAVATVFATLANSEQGKLVYLTDLFINAAEQYGDADDTSAKHLRGVIRSDSDYTAAGHGVPSADLISFFKSNSAFFKRVLQLDERLGIRPDAGAALLQKRLGNTKNDDTGSKKQAVNMTVYALQRIRLYCYQVVTMLQNEAKSRTPKPAAADHPAAPGGDAHPAAKPADSKPAGASMQAQADANHDAARTAPASPADVQKNLDDTVAELVKKGYDATVAKRLASRVPKGTPPTDAINLILGKKV